VNVVAALAPDVLLLDFYIPPKTGLAVLEALNAAVAAGTCARPRYILGMSSVRRCNEDMLAAGADAAFIKWDVWTWERWARAERGPPGGSADE
jgi:hypothetical protein